MGKDADDKSHPDKTQKEKQDRADHYEKQRQEQEAGGNGGGQNNASGSGWGIF